MLQVASCRLQGKPVTPTSFGQTRHPAIVRREKGTL